LFAGFDQKGFKIKKIKANLAYMFN
jgi:hypothetical protein